MDANNVEENGALNGKIKEHPSEPTSKAREFFRKRWFLLFVVFLVLLVIVCIILLLVFLIPYVKREVKRDFRLPPNVSPEHYDLEIRPHLEPEDLRFEGVAVITFACVNTTDTLILHGNGLNVRENSLDVASTDGKLTLDVIHVGYDKENEFIIFTLCQNLQVGRKYNIRMKYDGKLSNALGFSAIKYQDNGVEKYVAFTKFERTYARRAFPCFDEPHYKARFTISIVRRKKYVSLSNMPRKETLERDDDWEVDKFQTSVVMSTYLVAFVIGEFKSIENGKVAVWYLRNNTDMEFILDIAHKTLDYFQRYFRIDYDLPKLDHVIVPEYPSYGMENWGLIMYKENAFHPEATRTTKAALISHENVHQWFGNLVTPKWWDDLWLNEGFARYFASVGVHGIHPEWRMVNKGDIPHTLALDIFSYFPYEKDVLVLNVVGFTEIGYFLRNYEMAVFQTNVQEKWKVAVWYLRNNTDMEFILDIAHKTLDYFQRYFRIDYDLPKLDHVIVPEYPSYGMENWGLIMYKENAFHPEATRTTKAALISHENVHQWFGNLVTPKWWDDLWLNEGFARYFASVGVHGIHPEWRMPSLNRIQILKDAMFFADKGDIPHTLALDIFSYFPYEKDVLVLNVVGFTEIGYFLRNYEMAVFQTNVQEKWKKFIQYALGSIYARYLHNWAKEKIEEELFLSKNTYISILCKYGYKNCLSNSREVMKELMKGKDPKEM
ncbi:leucyl-cystinyl aminopeptidase-like [Centruroides sculpturatus]|uniref:leucyl-cystinyl aminopeptidase-like n=1 Tax=Centruroides sculpturatus TaxID=218467 RepID=UPI000C6E00E5|nr:leucyl-cystinyl aminopeptidase-like [Centruroides sculpturatus]